MPSCWRKYMVLNKRANIGGVLTWLALRVIPMGWTSACALAQHLHANLMRHHAQLPPQLQLRGDRAPAQGPDGRLERFYQIYIDNIR
eukprot:6454856-Amphidinium_carterae.1